MCQKLAHTILLCYVYRDHTFVYREILAKIHSTETMCVKHQYYSLTHIISIISLIVISPLIIIRFLLLVRPKEYDYHARKRVSYFILRSDLDRAIKSTLRGSLGTRGQVNFKKVFARAREYLFVMVLGSVEMRYKLSLGLSWVFASSNNELVVLNVVIWYECCVVLCMCLMRPRCRVGRWLCGGASH